MSTATGRITARSRRGSSAMAPQHRHMQFGTSWPCASPPSSFLVTVSNSPSLPYTLSTSAVGQAQRGSLTIANAAFSAACSSKLSGSAAFDFVTSPAPVPRRGHGCSNACSGASVPISFCNRQPAALAAGYSTAAASASCGSPHGCSHTNGNSSHTNGSSSRRCHSSRGNDDGGGDRWPVPLRSRVRSAAVASISVNAVSTSAGSAAAGAGAGPGAGGGAATTRPPSPSLGLSISYFDGFCPEGATECSPVWEQLRWCSKWQQMRQVYDNLLRAEATALAAMQVATGGAAGGNSRGGSCSDSVSSTVDQLTRGATVVVGAAAATTPPGCAPGLLSRDETYAFLLQLQDFYHLQLDTEELGELQAFRCRLVRDLSVYVRQLNAEQLEALCCASAVSGKCLTRERADAVQQRLLKILTSTSPSKGSGNGNVNGHNGNGHNGNGSVLGNDSYRARRREGSVGGFHVLTPALNTIFALYDHGYLPQVALLQAVFRQAVDHCGEVTRSQWHGLHGLARRFRFLLDDVWLEDLHAYLQEPLSCAATDFGRMASILGCISAFTVNKAIEALDTRVLVVVEAIERRYDEGRSLLTAHQLVVFTSLLLDMQSPFRTKWLGHCLDHLASCRSHLAGLPPATLVLAVELVLRGRSWDEQRLLDLLLRQLFSSYAKHPTASLRGTSNVSGCPPRAASRIISFSAASPSLPSSSNSLSAMAAAAAWDVDVGGAGGAASPKLDLASLVDWLAAKVPLEPGPQRSDTLDFLQPLVSALVEDGRPQLASLEPRRLPGLIRSVAVLGVSPSRQWVSEAFRRVAGGAAELSGSELVAMLRLSHAQGLPLPHATLDAVCGQHARILPLMRAVDLCRLLECWVADRYIPSREQLEGFFDAVCDAFSIDLAALKAAAAGAGSIGGGGGSTAAAGQGLATASLDESFDSESAMLRASVGRGSGGSTRKEEPSPATSYMDLEMLQAAGGAMSAGAADGVAGSLPVRRSVARDKAAGNGVLPSPPPPPKPAATGTTAVPSASSIAVQVAASAATASAAATVAADSTAVAVGTSASTTSATCITSASASAADARFQYKVPSLGSVDGRPKGSLLQPSEAQSMRSLLDQYGVLLLSAKRSDLLVVMNKYRNAVTAALREMQKAKGAARQPTSSRLLQAVLRGGDGNAGGGGGSGGVRNAGKVAAAGFTQPRDSGVARR